MNQLARVQAYLDPDNLTIVDKIAKNNKIAKSQIIRDSLYVIVDRYTKTSNRPLTGEKASNKNPLEELVGCGKSKTGTVGLNVDEIYLHD